MLVKDVIDFLGNKNDKVNGIIICLDATKEVVQEAIDSNKNLIISFHPIIFNSLKQLSPGNCVMYSVFLIKKC